MNNENKFEWSYSEQLINSPEDACELRLDKNGKVYWANADFSIITPATGFAVEANENDLILLTRELTEHSYQDKQSLIKINLLSKGVTFYDSERVDVRGDLLVGQNVVIDVNVIFEGKVKLGNNVKIGPNCIIKDCIIEDNVVIEANSILDNSFVCNGATIGPFARLRPDSVIRENAKIGNFVEIKKSDIGKGSKINHFSYIGDAKVGSKVNVGAGVITANYDGVNKFKTEIGDDAFIGTNSTLIAPVKVGKNTFIAAGSSINEDVEENQLSIARKRQRNIDNWKRPLKN